MAKVERKTEKTTFRVLVSFDGLERGDTFEQDADDMGWALMHTETGYLEVVEASDGRSEVGQG